MGVFLVLSLADYFRMLVSNWVNIDSALSKEQVLFWQENGFLILPSFFCTSEIQSVNNIIDRIWADSNVQDSKIVADIFIQTNHERRVRLHDAPTDARNFPHKINDIFLEYQDVRDVILSERLGRILTQLMGQVPIICNTLNLKFGSQQDFHTDSLYMTPLSGLNLIATWIALEDCHQDAGPLVYYPGSHKIRPFLSSNGRMTAIGNEMVHYNEYMLNEIRRMGLEPQRFLPKAGDLLIWHSQLYHGGSPIIDKALSRKSLVTHYYSASDWSSSKIKLHNFGYSQVRAHQFCES